jgi:hypothetical protein
VFLSIRKLINLYRPYDYRFYGVELIQLRNRKLPSPLTSHTEENVPIFHDKTKSLTGLSELQLSQGEKEHTVS